MNLGRLGWVLSFAISFVVYWVLCTVWPTRNQRLVKEMGLRWESQSGDTVIAEDGTVFVEEGREVRPRDESSEEIYVGREQGYGGGDEKR